MSSKMRNRRLFAQPTMQETVRPLLWPDGDCIGSGRKIKYQHPDDVPTQTSDGARLWAYECEFCGSWHATSTPPHTWRTAMKRDGKRA